MPALAYSTHRLDRIAIGLSGLCVVHCLGTTLILAMIASVGGFLGAHWIHEVGIGFAMLLGALALGGGIISHGYMMPSAVGGLGLGVMAGALSLPHDVNEALVTIVGVALLALGHDLNRRAAA